MENWLLSSLMAFRYDSSNTSLPLLPNVAGSHALSNSSTAAVLLVVETARGRVSLRMVLPTLILCQCCVFGGQTSLDSATPSRCRTSFVCCNFWLLRTVSKVKILYRIREFDSRLTYLLEYPSELLQEEKLSFPSHHQPNFLCPHQWS